MIAQDEALRVLLVDDHVLVREGLRFLLESSGSIKVVAEAGSAEEALQLLGVHSCDLLILDLNLPKRSGLWFTTHVRECYPKLPILILSVHTDETVVLEVVRSGANGFVAKSATRAELLCAVQALGDGGSYFDARVSAAILASVGRDSGPDRDFSPRDRQILAFLQEGLSNQAMAERLHLSLSSVKNGVRRLFAHYGVKDRTALLRAIEGGVTLDPTPPPQA